MLTTRLALRLLPALFLLSLAAPARAQWQEVGIGIATRQFRVKGENDAFVARLDRSEPRAIIDTAIAKGKLSGGMETVRSMAERTNGTVGYWGEAWEHPYTVVAAINGDFYNMSTGVPEGGQIIAGTYAKRFPNFGYSGFAWKFSREVFLCLGITHDKDAQLVAYPQTGKTQEIADVNQPRGAGMLVLYTEHYGDTTGTDASGVEVVVQMDRPSMVLPRPGHARGTVKTVRDGKGSTPLGSREVVLSAAGSAATTLRANAPVGAEVQISQSIKQLDPGCKQDGSDWTKTYAAVGGNWVILRDGVVVDIDKTGAVIRNPRTAIAYNDQYVFFVVVDGRSAQSLGMNMQELATFCRDELQAKAAINQDGGGSSTLWAGGKVLNTPSDGSERAVANAIMMINIPTAPILDARVSFEAGLARDGSSDGSAPRIDAMIFPTAPESGCGCAVADQGSLPLPAALLLAVALLVRRARRRAHGPTR